MRLRHEWTVVVTGLLAMQAGYVPWSSRTLSAVESRPDKREKRPSENRRQLVRLGDWRQLKPGMVKAEVDKVFGTPGRLEFTYLAADRHNWSLASYGVDGFGAFILFRDNVAYKASRTIEIKFKDGPDDGGTGRHMPPSDMSDVSWVIEAIQSLTADKKPFAESRNNVADEIDRLEKRDRGRTKEEKNASVALSHAFQKAGWFDANNQSTIAKAYRENAEYLDRFDPWKVDIGVSIDRVGRMFGKPLYSEKLKSGEEVMLYGPADPTVALIVPNEVAFSPVLVSFLNNRVVRVISDSYFNDKWRLKMWPGRQIPGR